MRGSRLVLGVGVCQMGRRVGRGVGRGLGCVV